MADSTPGCALRAATNDSSSSRCWSAPESRPDFGRSGRAGCPGACDWQGCGIRGRSYKRAIPDRTAGRGWSRSSAPGHDAGLRARGPSSPPPPRPARTLCGRSAPGMAAPLPSGRHPGAPPDDWRTLRHAHRQAQRTDTRRARGRGACRRRSTAVPSGGSGRRAPRRGRAFARPRHRRCPPTNRKRRPRPGQEPRAHRPATAAWHCRGSSASAS